MAEQFCDSCGYTPDAGSSVMSAPPPEEVSDRQMQQGASSNPMDSLPKPGDPVEGKSSSIEIRAELTQ
jgi:hypothetical protein